MISTGGQALVCGGGGFIGTHLVRRLKQDGLTVRAVDLKRPSYSDSIADEFIIGDLRNSELAIK
jgi:nucleoside-diphosphate-sugar epimerase